MDDSYAIVGDPMLAKIHWPPYSTQHAIDFAAECQKGVQIRQKKLLHRNNSVGNTITILHLFSFVIGVFVWTYQRKR